MEFLMTYGWAVLILLTVVAILFYLGIFNPRTVSPNACVLPAGFSCYGYRIASGGAGNGNLTLDLVQTTGHSVNITDMACTDQDTVTYTAINQRAYDGDRLTISLNCTKSDGTRPEVGEYYRGSIYINYMDEQTNFPHRIVGDIIYRVEQQTS